MPLQMIKIVPTGTRVIRHNKGFTWVFIATDAKTGTPTEVHIEFAAPEWLYYLLRDLGNSGPK